MISTDPSRLTVGNDRDGRKDENVKIWGRGRVRGHNTKKERSQSGDLVMNNGSFISANLRG